MTIEHGAARLAVLAIVVTALSARPCAAAPQLVAGAAAPLAPSPSPSPSASPRAEGLRDIGRTATTRGRQANLVGTAAAASEGTIEQQQIETRPLLRPGEVLEAIPGLIVSQHSGEGKANQYYLRGFQLDHGTDLAATIDGIPVNMPTHAHGQGYSDINWLMPELVSFVTFKKGPYYADEGDFSTAGAYDLFYRNTIPATVSTGAGDYGYDRIFVAGSPRLGGGNLLYALEAYHDNGTFVRPDEYKKLNGVLRWSRTTANSSFAATVQGYRGDFNSSDQVPQRLVAAGELSPSGSVDPTDGGRTYRYALSTSWEHDDRRGATRVVAYAESYGLDLFSNFTYDLFDAGDYYNVTANPVTCNGAYTTCAPGPQHVSGYTSYCPSNATAPAAAAPRSIAPAPFAFACGDQREQEDKRSVSGVRATRTLMSPAGETTIGIALRNDNIFALGLFLTHEQLRYAGGTLSDDRVVERDAQAWIDARYHLTRRLRIGAGLRADAYAIRVTDFQPANSGRTAEGMLSPKLTTAYAISPSQELYADAGESFHSNDGRGTTQTLDPQTHATIDPTGAPVQRFSPLVRAWGAELGYRLSTAKLTTTVAFWRLNIASELVFDGDHGVTTPNGPTVRKGIELANFYRPTPSLTLDADVATATARFTTNPAGLGTYVPEALNVVSSAGITLDRPAYAVSLRYRYFGPRVLDQAGDAVSSSTSLLNVQGTLKGRRGSRLTLDVFNLLNARTNDVEYFYGSWLPQDAKNPAYARDSGIDPLLGGGGVNDYHLHPAEARIVRLTYSLRP